MQSVSPKSWLQNLLAIHIISMLPVLLLYRLSQSVLWSAFYKQIQQNSQQGNCFSGLEYLVPVSYSEYTGGSLTAWTSWEGSLSTAWKSLIMPSKYISPVGIWAFNDVYVWQRTFSKWELGCCKNKMEWLGRCWTMECFPWASLLTLQWSWPSLRHWQPFWNRGNKLSSF